MSVEAPAAPETSEGCGRTQGSSCLGAAGGEDSAEEDAEDDWQARYGPPPRFEEPCLESPRFEVGDPAALEYLCENGYVIFAAVLSSQEVETAMHLFWEFLEDSTGGLVCRDRPDSWGAAQWPGQSSNGLLAAPGIGQAPFMWFVRTRPSVLRAFADIWGLQKPDELIVSFDGAGAFRPTSMEPAWRTKGGWFHTDQNGRTTGSDFTCAQGIVALTNNDDSTGGLAVLPGSHKQHRKIFERWPLKRENDFFILPRVDPLLSRDSVLRPRLLRVNAGDLAIWDSRCVHCNVPARHRFDEMPLDEALASAGVEEAGAPLLRSLTSVSDACWAYSSIASEAESDLEGVLERWGVEGESVKPVVKAIAAWSAELAQDLVAHGKTHQTQPAQLARAVAYVCAMPRARVPPEMLPRRVKAALLGGTTTHWPDKCLVFSTCPTRRNLAFILRQEPLVLRLIGCRGEDISQMQADLETAWEEIHAEAAERRARRAAAESATPDAE